MNTPSTSHPGHPGVPAYRLGNRMAGGAGFRAVVLVLLLVLAAFVSRAQYDLPGGNTYGWGLSQVLRYADNAVRLYSSTWISGDNWMDWTALLDNAMGYQNGSPIDGPVYVIAPMRYYPQGAWAYHNFTLSQQGVGTYQRTAQHRASHTLWGTYYIGQTSASQLISRPTIYRDGPQPWYLGGSATSGTYTRSTTFRSDPMGATSTPHWFFVAGSGTGYATLSCQDCTAPVYTVTNGSPGCWQYNVQIRASYGGLETDTFWIFNDSPYSLDHMRTTPVYGLEGWKTNKTLKVLDMCGGGMNWVAVNETFQGAWFPYPEQTSLWLPFNWQWAVWTQFNQYGEFDDEMWEYRLPGKYPQPMDTGANGNSEAPQHTVSQANQKFYAGSQTGGAGVLVQQNVQLHYLDHGNHH